MHKTKYLPKEGYQLKITEKEIIVYFNDTDGMLNALKTMRQLSETLPGNMRCFPAVTIEDWPARNFRGIHFCVFPDHYTLKKTKKQGGKRTLGDFYLICHKKIMKRSCKSDLFVL